MKIEIEEVDPEAEKAEVSSSKGKLRPIWRKFERIIAILVFGVIAVRVAFFIPVVGPLLGLLGVGATLWAAYEYGLKRDSA